MVGYAPNKNSGVHATDAHAGHPSWERVDGSPEEWCLWLGVSHWKGTGYLQLVGGGWSSHAEKGPHNCSFHSTLRRGHQWAEFIRSDWACDQTHCSDKYLDGNTIYLHIQCVTIFIVRWCGSNGLGERLRFQEDQLWKHDFRPEMVPVFDPVSCECVQYSNLEWLLISYDGPFDLLLFSVDE